MDSLYQSFSPPAARTTTMTRDNCLSLYDRYSSLAYGIILRIIPEPELAQSVLIDLFTCSEVKSYTESHLSVSTRLIRLARAKALEARPATAQPSPSTDDDLDKLVFELSFYEGCSIQEIAERLSIAPAIVMKKIAHFFNQQRTVK